MNFDFFFFNDTATTEIYTLSLHDALPIFTPQVCSSPALSIRNVSPPTTGRGCGDHRVVSPDPSWPYRFAPQQWARWSLVRPHQCCRPPVILTSGGEPGTGRGGAWAAATVSNEIRIKVSPQQYGGPISASPHACPPPSSPRASVPNLTPASTGPGRVPHRASDRGASCASCAS